MTLADLIRKYFEDRRKHCEQKARYLNLTDNCRFFTDQDQDEKFLSTFNTQHFSNNLDPNKNDQSKPVGSSQQRITRQIGVSKSSRVITLPDGTTKTETIIRDSNGNEEKYITHQKDGKKYTTIIRKDPSGTEQIEKKVADIEHNDIYKFDTFLPNSRSDKTSDSGFDFWFQKFFSPEEKPADSWTNENMPFDYNANIEEQIENILKGFVHDSYKTNGTKKENDTNGFFPGDFPKMNDSLFNNEARKFLENFDKESSKSKSYRKKNGSNNVQKQVDSIIKSISPPPPPSMFETFAEHAMIEIPEEKTSLDKFIEADEDYRNERLKLYREKENVIKKLDKYFSGKLENRVENDVYSDIEDPKDIDLSEMFPKQNSDMPPNMNDLSDTILKNLNPRKLFEGGIQTKIYVENEKRRIESIQKDDKGNTVKKITYKIRDKSYSLVTVIDKFGKQVKRERNFNFSEDELNNFKNQWDKQFHSDFKE